VQVTRAKVVVTLDYHIAYGEIRLAGSAYLPRHGMAGTVKREVAFSDLD
jgi:hypothetical protein